MKNKEKTTWLQTAGILLFAAACTMALYSLYLCFGSDIWYDELFTEGFISQPVGRMISLAVKDVHPPLYYLLVKIAVDFCRFFVPSANAVIISKVVSVLPYLGLLGYSLVFLRRRYGWLCAGLFSFCIFAMPQMANYTTEVRMYGFALFFITAAFFHAGAILENGGKRNWIALTVFGICAAYTHYFAAVSAAVLYVGLAVLLYVRKKDTRTKSLLTWLLCVGISVLAYLPWLPDAVGQVSQVRENYWILPLTLSCFGGCVKFVLKPSTGYQWPDYVLAVLLFVLLAGLLAAAFFKRKEDEKRQARMCMPFWPVYPRRNSPFRHCGIFSHASGVHLPVYAAFHGLLLVRLRFFAEQAEEKKGAGSGAGSALSGRGRGLFCFCKRRIFKKGTDGQDIGGAFQDRGRGCGDF